MRRFHGDQAAVANAQEDVVAHGASRAVHEPAGRHKNGMGGPGNGDLFLSHVFRFYSRRGVIHS